MENSENTNDMPKWCDKIGQQLIDEVIIEFPCRTEKLINTSVEIDGNYLFKKEISNPKRNKALKKIGRLYEISHRHLNI